LPLPPPSPPPTLPPLPPPLLLLLLLLPPSSLLLLLPLLVLLVLPLSASARTCTNPSCNPAGAVSAAGEYWVLMTGFTNALIMMPAILDIVAGNWNRDLQMGPDPSNDSQRKVKPDSKEDSIVATTYDALESQQQPATSEAVDTSAPPTEVHSHLPFTSTAPAAPDVAVAAGTAAGAAPAPAPAPFVATMHFSQPERKVEMESPREIEMRETGASLLREDNLAEEDLSE
jgi:hypothetical protein